MRHQRSSPAAIPVLAELRDDADSPRPPLKKPGKLPITRARIRGEVFIAGRNDRRRRLRLLRISLVITIPARGRWPDVVDLAPRRRPCFSLRPLRRQVDHPPFVLGFDLTVDVASSDTRPASRLPRTAGRRQTGRSRLCLGPVTQTGEKRRRSTMAGVASGDRQIQIPQSYARSMACATPRQLSCNFQAS
jgi:hypothetical protein